MQLAKANLLFVKLKEEILPTGKYVRQAANISDTTTAGKA